MLRAGTVRAAVVMLFLGMRAAGAGLVTFTFSGTVSDVTNLDGLLPLPVVAAGDTFSLTYTFDTATADDEPALTFGTYALSSMDLVMVNLGSFTESGEIRIVNNSDYSDPVTGEDFFDVDAYVVGAAFDAAPLSLVGTMEMSTILADDEMSVFASDALPAAPPDLFEFETAIVALSYIDDEGRSFFIQADIELLESSGDCPRPCNDGVDCTEDVCVNGSCEFNPIDALCDNGNFCDGAETCDPFGGCEAGTPPDCNDGNVCTTDSCSLDENECVHVGSDALCDNGRACDGLETCDPDLGCQPGTPLDCNDGVVCTFDTCDENTDACVHTPNDDVCDNGDFCDGIESCDPAAGCQPGAPQDCSDGVACTVDSCDEATDSCVHQAVDANCDNGDFCDGTETCDPQADCQPGTGPDCSDGVACTVDSCDEDIDSCLHQAVDATCDNGDACDGLETCDPENDCQAGSPPDCNDGVSCTLDTCDPLTGACMHAPDDDLCNNGDFCDGDEVCGPGGCVTGTPRDCNDGVACTVDSCDETTDACVHLPSDDLCNNGDFCDGDEICGLDGCESGAPRNCNDGVACTADACDEAADVCVHTPLDSFCDNDESCDGLETCDPVEGCQLGDPPNCNDGIACTIDTCDPATGGCVNTPSDDLCNNGDFCDGDEVCGSGGCELGAPRNCSDGVACTADTCDEAADACVHMPVDSFCDNSEICDGSESCDPVKGCQPGDSPECNDGIACTFDTCDPATGACVHTPSDALCNNGDFCDGDEVCGAAGCEAGDPRNCNDGVACTLDTCDEKTNACVHAALDEFCDNGDICDGSETCDPVDGCQPGDPPDCNDGIVCTIDNCDPLTGACVHVASDAQCDNGRACDGLESCDPTTGCLPGTPLACNDGVACTVDSCDEKTDACVHTPLNELCDNGDFCDGLESCDPAGGCQPGIPPDCSDGVACTLDVCDENSDSCLSTPSDEFCNNGDFCDGEEGCDPIAGCQAGSPPDCNDGLVCTVDSCDEISDNCVHAPDLNFCDNGDFCDGFETCDPNGDCLPGTPPTCDDGVACTVDSCDEGVDACISVPQDVLCEDGSICTVDICTFQGCVFELVSGAECAVDADCAADELCQECICMPAMEVIGACCIPPASGDDDDDSRPMPGDDDDDNGDLPGDDDDDDDGAVPPPYERPGPGDDDDDDDDGDLPGDDDDDDDDDGSGGGLCVPLSEADCLAMDGVFLGIGSICRPGICGSDVCEDGKPCALTLTYTGDDCNASDHSQSSSAVTCTGDPEFALEVSIIASDDADAGDGLIWFEGNVLLGDSFVLEAANAGEDRLKSNTFVHIFDAAGRSLLQVVKFHTSCSQPLAIGDQFGGVALAGFVPDGQCDSGEDRADPDDGDDDDGDLPGDDDDDDDAPRGGG